MTIKFKVLRPLADVPYARCSSLNCGHPGAVETAIGYQCTDHFLAGPLGGREGYEWDETPGPFGINGVPFESLGYPNGAVRMPEPPAAKT